MVFLMFHPTNNQSGTRHSEPPLLFFFFFLSCLELAIVLSSRPCTSSDARPRSHSTFGSDNHAVRSVLSSPPLHSLSSLFFSQLHLDTSDPPGTHAVPTHTHCGQQHSREDREIERGIKLCRHHTAFPRLPEASKRGIERFFLGRACLSCR